MTAPLKLAVIGAGIMGTNHARVARQLPEIELVAVVDQDIDKATAACGTSGAVATTNLDDVIGRIEAAVVAVPTQFHVEVAIKLAEAGVHLLVEKPLAPTIEEGEQIVAAADAAGVTLAVGHIERFNPAVAELPRLLDRPVHIEASRIGSYSPRISDGVIFDLMIHDLDIVLSLVGDDCDVEEISGVARRMRSQTEDLASATIAFSNGMTAAFNTSRLGQQKVRTIEITQMESAIVADLIRRDVTIHRMSQQEYLSDEGTRYRQSSVMEIPYLQSAGEPLQLELSHFAECVRSGQRPLVDGRAGLRALDLAVRVTDAVAHR
jgi:predicted dehydrogenase